MEWILDVTEIQILIFSRGADLAEVPPATSKAMAVRPLLSWKFSHGGHESKWDDTKHTKPQKCPRGWVNYSELQQGYIMVAASCDPSPNLFHIFIYLKIKSYISPSWSIANRLRPDLLSNFGGLVFQHLLHCLGLKLQKLRHSNLALPRCSWELLPASMVSRHGGPLHCNSPASEAPATDVQSRVKHPKQSARTWKITPANPQACWALWSDLSEVYYLFNQAFLSGQSPGEMSEETFSKGCCVMFWCFGPSSPGHEVETNAKTVACRKQPFQAVSTWVWGQNFIGWASKKNFHGLLQNSKGTPSRLV